VAVHRLVPHARQVPLAVRDVLEDGGHGGSLRGARQPDAGGEPAAVRERDPAVLDLADGARERGHHPHRRPPGCGGATLTLAARAWTRPTAHAAPSTGTASRAARGRADPPRGPSS